MKDNEEIICLLKQANFISYIDRASFIGQIEYPINEVTDLPMTIIQTYKSDIFSSHYAFNTISQHIILRTKRHWESDSLYNDYFVFQYDTEMLRKKYLQHKQKIESFLNLDYPIYWDRKPESIQVRILFQHTDLFDFAYANFPTNWISEDELAKWLEKRIKLNIPRELIKVDLSSSEIKHNILNSKEILGEYVLITPNHEIKMKLKNGVGASLSGGKRWVVDSQKIIEIEPICEYMLGWSLPNLLQFCTINNFKLKRTKILETM